MERRGYYTERSEGVHCGSLCDATGLLHALEVFFEAMVGPDCHAGPTAHRSIDLCFWQSVAETTDSGSRKNNISHRVESDNEYFLRSFVHSLPML